MVTRRLVAALASCLLILAVAEPAGAAAKSTASAAPSLAAGFAHAGSTTGRVAALEQITQALGIAVMDPADGRFVVAGPARSEQEGYLYTNELKATALAAAAHRTVPLTTIASVINAAGYADAGLAVTPQGLADALVAAAKEAKKSSSSDRSGWLNLRLVRAFGLLRHQDLATVAADSLTALDPVQALLVVEDFTQPETAALPVATSGTELPTSTGGLLRKVAAKKTACAKAAAGAGHQLPVFGALAATWATEPVLHGRRAVAPGTSAAKTAARIAALVKAAAHAKAAAKLLDAQHGVTAEADVNLTTKSPDLPIALGSGPVRFGAKVEVSLTLTNNVVRCGYLTSIDFHGHGTVPDVAVTWAPGGLDQWGTLAPGGAAPVSRTDSTGWAWLTFTPFADLAHTGAELAAKGTAGASAMVAGGTASGDLPWVISYHDTVNLTYAAHVTYDFDCDGPNCPIDDTSGTSSISYTGNLSGSAAVPLSFTDNETGQGTTSEALDLYTQNETFVGATNVFCPEGTVDGHDDFVATGTTAGPFLVNGLTISGATNAIDAINLTYAFGNESTRSAGENLTETAVNTGPADCLGQETFHVTDYTGVSTVEDVHNQAGQQFGYDIELPATAWTIASGWTPAKGGVLATATIPGQEDYPEASERVSETITLATPTPGRQ